MPISIAKNEEHKMDILLMVMALRIYGLIGNEIKQKLNVAIYKRNGNRIPTHLRASLKSPPWSLRGRDERSNPIGGKIASLRLPCRQAGSQ